MNVGNEMKKSKMLWTGNRMPKNGAKKEMALMSAEAMKEVHQFHRSFPQYCETPLANLQCLAKLKGVGGIYVKDESYRFGLNAFKVLGGSYAMARFIAEQTGRSLAELGYEQLVSPEIKKELGTYTFFTATDGNHGRGVAWTANQIGQKAVVYMPKGSSEFRLNAIRKEGARAEITELSYMGAVKRAYAESLETENSVVVQDTAWPGYEEIPSWIMQGYGTMAMEAEMQLKALGVTRPTHVFIQAGVGSAAGAVLGYFANQHPEQCPVTIVVEAGSFECLYDSALKGDGSVVEAPGDKPTIMAGLACEEANTVSWEILREKAAFFVSLGDTSAARAMRVLSAPVGDDPRMVSGESGAAGMGALLEMLDHPEYADFRAAAGIDENSQILLFSTEGDTDPEHYRHVVWDGAYPSDEG